jgi:hypothetical protein
MHGRWVGGGHKGTVQFQVEPVRGGEGAVYMQVGWERCRKMMDAKSRAQCDELLQEIIQGDAFW